MIPDLYEKAKEHLDGLIDEDGALNYLRATMRIVRWKPGEATVGLEGDFTSDDLAAIAIYMDRHEIMEGAKP